MMAKYNIYDVLIDERYAFTVHVPEGARDVEKYIIRRHPSLKHKTWRYE